MARHADLMGLGLNNQLALVLAKSPVIATAYGTSVGSANQIQGTQYFTICLTGTSSFALPQVTSDRGAYIGDQFVVANMSSAAVAIYAANTAQGSVVTVYSSAVSTAGTTGVAVPAGAVANFQIVSVSTWVAGAMVNSALLPTVPQQLEIVTPVTVTVYGTTIGSASPIASNGYFTLCTTGTSALLMPQLNATTGPYAGDKFTIANFTTASIKVFAAQNANGSAVTFYGGAASAAGSATGLTIPTGDVATLQLYSISTWAVGIASV